LIPIADSNVLIDWLRGREEARALVGPAFEESGVIAASVLSRTELLHGLRPHERPAFERLASALDWIPVTAEIADAAGEMASAFRRSHAMIETVDYVIGASAQTIGASLWTRNVKHFPMFPGLRAPY